MTGSFICGGYGIAGNLVSSNGVVAGPRIGSYVLSIADFSPLTRPKATLTFAYQPLTLLYYMTLWEVLPYLVKVRVSWV